jgi:hypothetical protein
LENDVFQQLFSPNILWNYTDGPIKMISHDLEIYAIVISVSLILVTDGSSLGTRVIPSEAHLMDSPRFRVGVPLRRARGVGALVSEDPPMPAGPTGMWPGHLSSGDIKY